MTAPSHSWDLCILIRRPPYGSIQAAEGVRHLVGAVSQGLRCVALLVGEGVWLARAAQDPGESGWLSMAKALQDALAPVGHEPLLVLADLEALTASGLEVGDLIPGVAVADDKAMSEALVQSHHVLIF